MKKIFLLFAICFNFILLQAQETVELESLKAPDSPGFQILDISPTSIERPQNPKALGASLLSLANDGKSIPKNFAMEVSPYWYIKDQNASVYKYLNIGEGKVDVNGNVDDNVDFASFNGIFDKLSISIASVYNDTISGSLLSKTNYLSIGARTNLFTFRKAKQNKYLNGVIAKVSARVLAIRPSTISTDAIVASETMIRARMKTKERERDALQTSDTAGKARYDELIKVYQEELDVLGVKKSAIRTEAPDKFEKVVKGDKELQDLMKELDAPPLIQIDGAFAYSEAFPDNATVNRRFNRSGIWTNIAVNSSGMSDENPKYNFAGVLLVKYINDNILTDEVNKIFEREKALDIGIKIDFTIKDFSLAFEHVHRKYSGNNGTDSNRNVYVMQYKISDGMYFTGSYGKNFGEVNNVFTLLGVNYGFGPKSLTPIK